MSVARNGRVAQAPTELISQATRLTAAGLKMGVAEKLLGVPALGLSKVKAKHSALWEAKEREWRRARKNGDGTLERLCAVLNDEHAWEVGNRKSETRRNLARGAFLTALTRNNGTAARLLGLHDTAVYRFQKYPDWRPLSDAAKSAVQIARNSGILPSKNDPGAADGEEVPRQIWKEFWDIVAIVRATVVPEVAAAKQVDVAYATYWKHRQKYSHTFERICSFQGLGVDPNDELPTPSLRIRARMRKAAEIFVGGHSYTEAEKRISEAAGRKRAKRKGTGKKCDSGSTTTYLAKKRPRHWARLIREARAFQLIPEGMFELARLEFGSESTVSRMGRSDRPRKKRGSQDHLKNLKGKSRKKKPGPEVLTQRDEVIKREVKKNPWVDRQELARIVNRDCGALIGEGRLKKQTANNIRRRISELGISPRARKSPGN